MRSELGAILAAMGFQVTEARDGAEGIRAWRSCSPTVIFLDLEMPVFDGATVLRTIRGYRDQVRVVLVTGAPASRQVAAAVRLGASDYLPKPFSSLTVRAVLERIGLAGPAATAEPSAHAAAGPA